jgi:hypothetical protein
MWIDELASRLKTLDLNNNGVPDYKDGAVALWLLRQAIALVKRWAAPHTVAYRAAVTAEEALAVLGVQK